MSALAMLVGLGVDAVIGWPAPLFARIGHPVSWIGALIARLEARLNRPQASNSTRFLGGLATSLIAIGVSTGAGAAIVAVLPGGWIGVVLSGLFAAPLIATRSMHEHVAAVARPLMRGDLDAARHAVSMIVGRDPTKLDAAGVARAALESLAENASDGIVAPVFWGALFGLPGIAGYKAVNTLDSMIGHRTARYEYFGKAAARIDDLANLIPARLSGVLFALASRHPVAALRCMGAEAARHRSPNAGWPEAALAGGLGLRLSGPRWYGDQLADEPYVNAPAPDPTPGDLARGLGLFRRAMALMALGLVGIALF